MDRRQILLVDGNDDFLDGLASWLRWAPGLEVVGRAHSGAEAMERAEELLPEIVLMNVSLPDMSGFEVTRRLRERRLAPLVVLMTFHESHAAGVAAREAGADGCVSKTDITLRLLPKIEELLWRSREPEQVEEKLDR